MRTRLRHTKDGSFSPSEHREFARNGNRVNAFRKALDRLAHGKVVLDVGTGSGIVAILAAKAGAKRVVAIEKDRVITEIAMRNFERNRLSDRIELIVGDALESTSFPEPEIDILVGELLSTWCVVEPQVPVFKHLLGLIGGNPLIIPRRIINRVEGVNAVFGDDEGLVEIPQVYFEFRETDKARTLTQRKKASEILFSRDMGLDVALTVKLRATVDGKINALRLVSEVEVAQGICFGATNDTMPNMVVPLPEERSVKTGDEIKIRIEYTYGAGWENFKVQNL